ncbi:hypothetical protein PTNB85_05243 [Pyrenophora teres f. teres]|uniref:Uncharacterized protein n=1 Tax=Pyrenophora teres f. teres TaxID=97479 RepID=A0A6S6VUK3_9PLEO|nr:hypothetical protein HRS9139_04218 [Pyrenophora teres f. teres]KAE8837908.1 hypothetical protein PTNB85_05243 [Pyrenophora teres f. teres]KAE8862731.1 hypothetical protein PTNB29_05293 [Pyrenophora teres f. teres]CAE6998119.1 hypothetical protein PTTW11_00656 [Pyrenophora teres f. teres]
MKFPALPSTNVAVLLLLVAPNAVTAAIRVGGQGAGCCSNAGAQPPPGSPNGWCESLDILGDNTKWSMHCCKPLVNGACSNDRNFPTKSSLTFFERGRNQLRDGGHLHTDCVGPSGDRGWAACALVDNQNDLSPKPGHRGN